MAAKLRRDCSNWLTARPLALAIACVGASCGVEVIFVVDEVELPRVSRSRHVKPDCDIEFETYRSGVRAEIQSWRLDPH